MMSSGNGMESSGRGGGGGVGVAPFVAKTYAMVDDPATDGAVGWGRAGNSFVVADPFALSHALFPAHFKHSNFSSFVRQLNTYGFRKVDPDRWEFAHASFLRGQTHLLRHVVRRPSRKLKDDGSSTMSLAMEVTRLKQEQRATQDRLADMWRRVQETERRPLLKVAGDPDVLRRLVGDSSCFHGGPDEGAEAKRPRMLLGGEVQRVGKKKMSSVDADGLLYDINLQEEVYVLEPSVDFTGFYAGADGYYDVLVDSGY